MPACIYNPPCIDPLLLFLSRPHFSPGRMDSYVDTFMAAGGSMITLAKGNRSKQVTTACKKHGGFYLGSIGGPAAIIAQNNIKKASEWNGRGENERFIYTHLLTSTYAPPQSSLLRSRC
jgi:hypothetical protein